MNKVNVEKVIDYTKVLKDNEILQDMDKILRNENTNLKLEIERLQRQKEELQVNGLRQETLFKLEIERLNNIINELDKQNRQLGEKLSLTTDKYEKKLFIKENIIKEVREYIMTNGIHSDYGDKGIDDENKLLQILDKEKDNE